MNKVVAMGLETQHFVRVSFQRGCGICQNVEMEWTTLKVTSRSETKIQNTLLSKTQSNITCCYQKCVVPIPFIFLVKKCFNIFDEISFLLKFKRMYFVQCTVFVPVVVSM